MKKRTILLFGILVATMSSCVYSLFPIYTEDTLVFREELLGKWLLNEDGSDYMLFESTDNEDQEPKPKEYKYTLEVNDKYTIQSDEPISMVINGDTIYDENLIRIEMQRRMASNKDDSIDIAKDDDKPSIRKREFEGTVAVYQSKSYKLTVHEDDKDEIYMAHLTEIGDDLFLDLYPEIEYSSSFSENYFPVHTFLKVQIRQNELDFTFFDLDKLNKLFESNLIRLRHENVDGTILITAQPKELQKFLDKYSDDESVFDSTETYRKAS